MIRRAWILFAVYPAACAGVWRDSEPASFPAATVPASRPAFDAAEYFADRCARCHGPNGSGYDEEKLRKMPDPELREVIAEMAQGPAQAPLEDVQLDALMEYHRELIEAEPEARD